MHALASVSCVPVPEPVFALFGLECSWGLHAHRLACVQDFLRHPYMRTDLHSWGFEMQGLGVCNAGEGLLRLRFAQSGFFQVLTDGPCMDSSMTWVVRALHRWIQDPAC